jgi:hypothetical protein
VTASLQSFLPPLLLTKTFLFVMGCLFSHHQEQGAVNQPAQPAAAQAGMAAAPAGEQMDNVEQILAHDDNIALAKDAMTSSASPTEILEAYKSIGSSLDAIN